MGGSKSEREDPTKNPKINKQGAGGLLFGTGKYFAVIFVEYYTYTNQNFLSWFWEALSEMLWGNIF